MTRILLTGAGGFLGSHCLEHILENTDWAVVATDSFRNRGKTDRICYVLDKNPEWRSRVRVIMHDLTAPFSEQMVLRMGDIDHVIAFASESHVPRSIADPVPFIRNNTEIALTTLEYCRQVRPKTVVWISTDETYGPGEGHKEWDPILPSSPYASSKAAQEAIAFSYWRTYGLPVVIVNCANLIGETQDAEKYVPILIRRILKGEIVRIHGTPGNIGSRYYMHARNLADAVLFIVNNLPVNMFEQGGPVDRPDRYNITVQDCVSNLRLAEMVAETIGKPLHYELVGFDRPGHDISYGMDASLISSAGWKPFLPLEQALADTVRWFLKHPEWL